MNNLVFHSISRFVFLLLIMFGVFSLAAVPSKADDLSLAGKKILFLGDSITHNGLYVMLIEYYLEKQYPTAKFDIYSLGVASETASGLSEAAHPFPRPCIHERLWAALDVIKPDVVFACYGMNDGIYHPESPDRLAAFQFGIRKLINEVKSTGASLILITPPPYDPLPQKANTRPFGAPDYSYLNPYDHYDDVLADYAKWELTLPATDATVIDIHTPLSNYLFNQRKSNPTYSYSRDGIHPNLEGHLIMARAILTALGVPVESDDVETEIEKLNADPMWALVQKHNQTRAEAWTPYIGFTREAVYKTNSVNQAETDAATLQAQIDALRQSTTTKQ